MEVPKQSFRSALKSVSIEKADEEAQEMSILSEPIMMMKSANSTPVVRGDSGGGGGVHDRPSCFVAGTKVLLPDGKNKSIEKMERGDFVVSYNEETGEN